MSENPWIRLFRKGQASASGGDSQQLQEQWQRTSKTMVEKVSVKEGGDEEEETHLVKGRFLVLPYRVPHLAGKIVRTCPMFLIFSRIDVYAEYAGHDLVDRGIITERNVPNLYNYITGLSVLVNNVPLVETSGLVYRRVKCRSILTTVLKRSGQGQSTNITESVLGWKYVVYIVLPKPKSFAPILITSTVLDVEISEFINMLEDMYNTGAVNKYVINNIFLLGKALKITTRRDIDLVDVCHSVLTTIGETALTCTTFVIFQSFDNPRRGILLDLKRCLEYPRELTDISNVREIHVYKNGIVCFIIFKVSYTIENVLHGNVSQCFTLLKDRTIIQDLDTYGRVKKLVLRKVIGSSRR